MQQASLDRAQRTYVYDDVTYVYDDVTYVYDDVMQQASLDRAQRRFRYSIVAGKEVFWSFHQVPVRAANKAVLCVCVCVCIICRTCAR
jgi:hypothetical protein